MESVSSDCSEKSTPIAELIRSNALKAPFFKYGEDLYECLKHKNQIAKNSFEYEKGTLIARLIRSKVLKILSLER